MASSNSSIVTIGDTSFLGDLAVHELQLANPDLGYMFEEDRPRVAAARHAVFSRLADAGGRAAIAHLGLGRIERIAAGFAWVPLAEETGAPASN